MQLSRHRGLSYSHENQFYTKLKLKVSFKELDKRPKVHTISLKHKHHTVSFLRQRVVVKQAIKMLSKFNFLINVLISNQNNVRIGSNRMIFFHVDFTSCVCGDCKFF